MINKLFTIISVEKQIIVVVVDVEIFYLQHMISYRKDAIKRSTRK